MKTKGCLSSNPCGNEDTFLHEEHALCRKCFKRVPIPLNIKAFCNSTICLECMNAMHSDYPGWTFTTYRGK